MTKSKNKLSPEAYSILFEKGTEKPFSGEYNSHFEKGIYCCASCDQALFSSESKFPTSCGWPGFDASMSDSVSEERDLSHGMVRTEILCSQCKGHLGHVFNDGPTETGLRYCVNSLSIVFDEK